MLIEEAKILDCVIIGGGLAGLCLSIQLADKNYSVVLIEKNKYPFHKVCGEYISMESYDFIQSLGLNLDEMNLPIINQLNISAHNGYKIYSSLKSGGFGISRYTLDHELAKIAKTKGVELIESCVATNVLLQDDIYTVETSIKKLKSKLVCGSYGKIDPAFIDRNNNKKKVNYVGVKYHIKTPFPNNLIELHNFKDGYCGISNVDKHTTCLCYLTTAENLNQNNNAIKELEKNVLMKNPHLQKYFTEAEFIFEKPLAISQIGFSKKQTYKNDILMLGDAAGAIAPLCGNGMSIAMRSSKILSNYIDLFLKHKLSKNELIKQYTSEWNANFSFRIKSGYYLQQLFGKNLTTLLSLKLLNYLPFLFRKLIKLTHGKKF
ncbi:MAG: NAD(P)/FAD-dependent oxidoreductase [Bacteroidetes bacterium]|jgi:flavin-dependent dehydrogenase|nr:NAD(P)/FAD-dependent oxidoreductase [Bacteroidota bacterium]MCA6443115.1 NAD(P)/FAD-dependent oxidoreductase [Bacteroidota bacterium]